MAGSVSGPAIGRHGWISFLMGFDFDINSFLQDHVSVG